MKSNFHALIFSLTFVCVSAQVETDTVRGTIELGTNTNPVVEGENYILTIGIDEYQNWSQLRNAVNDAKGVHELFTQKLGFKEIQPPLLNAEATKENILTVLENEMPQKLGENDNLIIFFSGHGESYPKQIGNVRDTIGYLIPADAASSANKRFSSYIKASEFMNTVNELPAKHILIFLDACKSGIAINTDPATRSSIQYADDLRRKMSRNIVTSARANQVASDGGPIPNHSLFTGTLIEGFRTGLIDQQDNNGLVTSREIGLYLQTKVAQHPEAVLRQTPDFGSFGYDKRGELVIDLKDESFFTLQSRLNGLMQNGHLEKAWRLLSELDLKYSGQPETKYYTFRKQLFENNIEEAEAALIDFSNRIENQQNVYDLSEQDSWDLKQRFKGLAEPLKVANKAQDLEIIVYRIENTKQDSGELKQSRVLVAKDSIQGSEDQYTLEAASMYQFEVRNKGDKNQYLYTILYDTNGKFESVRLIDNWDVVDHGLQPGEVVSTLKILQDGQTGLERFDFFVSSKRERELENPAGTKARSAAQRVRLRDPNTARKTIYLIFK